MLPITKLITRQSGLLISVRFFSYRLESESENRTCFIVSIWCWAKKNGEKKLLTNQLEWEARDECRNRFGDAIVAAECYCAPTVCMRCIFNDFFWKCHGRNVHVRSIRCDATNCHQSNEQSHTFLPAKQFALSTRNSEEE